MSAKRIVNMGMAKKEGQPLGLPFFFLTVIRPATGPIMTYE